MTERDALETMTDATRLSCHTIERLMCEIWSDYLGCPVSPDDDYYDLGGDSLTIVDIVVAARGRGIPLRSSVALHHATPARLAESLTIGRDALWSPTPSGLPALLPTTANGALPHAPAWTPADSRPVPVVGGSAEPLYIVHSDNHVQLEREVVAGWESPRPVRALTLPGGRGRIPPYDGIGDIADRFVTALREDQRAGAYRLVGFGQGAVVAFETACRLRTGGDVVEFLAMIDPPPVGSAAGRPRGLDELLTERLSLLARRFGLNGAESLEAAHAGMREAGWYDNQAEPRDLPRLQLAWAELAHALFDYEPTDYAGPVLLVQDAMHLSATEQTWRHAVKDLRILPLDHGIASPRAVLRDPCLAQELREALIT
ncbi:thioesterase domain-containing protein [Streptomyces sp. NPDC001137]|uniref:thioesterase domain-containing protein n=1 Tax=Streptomyces sp. NPDC001137 TaxID=3154378 RepID=UPI0033173D61